MAKMLDGTLKSILSSKISNGTGYLGGTLAKDRSTAEKYYKGEPFGNEVEGRSQVVSRDVAEAVDSMMPPLIKIFTSGDEVVKFEPQGPEDEAGAKQATDYVNWVWMQDNPGFQIFFTWFKDALMKKVGIIKTWWEVSDHKTQESYQGLTDEQLAGLMADPELTVVEGSQEDYPAPPPAMNMGGAPPPPMPGSGAFSPSGPAPGATPPVPMPAPEPQMLHDIKFERVRKRGKVCIYPVPPDEFIIDRRAVDLDRDVGFMAHRRRTTVSELKELYPEKKSLIEDMSDGDADGDYNTERLERFSDTDEYPYRDSGVLDPSMRVVWVIECYAKIDYDGDGVAEWRKVVLGGSDGLGGEILLNEEIDDHPFAAICPIPMPHKFHGMSIADQTEDIQLIKSVVTRQILDNLYLNNAPMTEVVVGQVDLDDVLNRGPGRLVRVKAPGMVREIPTEPLGQEPYTLLASMDAMREQRTGVQRFSQGPGADALNNAYTETATGANIVESASQERLELIARVFAETGVKRAFRRVFELCCKYQDEPRIIKLRNEWVKMDPSTWNSQMDMTVHVGLGTGNKKEQVGIMTNMVMLAERLAAIPPYAHVVSPENLYNMCDKLSQASGLKSSVPYFTDPKTVPAQPPQPNPDLVKVQAQAQLQAQKQQSDAQLQAAQMQADQQAAMVKAQQQHAEAMAKLQLQQQQAQVDAALAVKKLEQEAALKQAELQTKAEIDRQALEAEIMMKRELAQAELGLEREKFGATTQLEAEKFQVTQGAQKEQFAASQDLEREKAGVKKPKGPTRKKVTGVQRDKDGNIIGATIEEAA